MRAFLVVISLLIATDAFAGPVIWLVRHAEKVDDSKDPAISEIGKLRAERIGKILRDVELKSVFVTHLQRTRLTAEPTLKTHSLQPVTLPADKTNDLVAQLKKIAAGDEVLVVGHSDTLPDIWKQLGCAKELKVAHTEFDLLLRIELTDGKSARCTKLRQGD